MRPKTYTFEVQKGSKGREFRLSATLIYSDLVISVFKYLDDNTFFAYFIFHYIISI